MNQIPLSELKSFLDEKADQYNGRHFIADDPIAVPHSFSKKEDIEIAALLSATIAWGQRKTIVKNAFRLLQLMDNSPHEFVLYATPHYLQKIKKFVHRTFNGNDAIEFIVALREIYQEENGLEKIFSLGENQFERIEFVHLTFSQLFINDHALKHVSSPAKGSAAKRLNMFLRWMVRNDRRGVDFGLWSDIPAEQLICPLDLHSGNVARKLGLLYRTQNDWSAAEELTASLRLLDKKDPVKYDFALFGLGIFEGFK